MCVCVRARAEVSTDKILRSINTVIINIIDFSAFRLSSLTDNIGRSCVSTVSTVTYFTSRLQVAPGVSRARS